MYDLFPDGIGGGWRIIDVGGNIGDFPGVRFVIIENIIMRHVLSWIGLGDGSLLGRLGPWME